MRAQGRHRASRREAIKHDGDRRWYREDHRLRHCPHARREAAHPARPGRRHGRLYGAGRSPAAPPTSAPTSTAWRSCFMKCSAARRRSSVKASTCSSACKWKRPFPRLMERVANISPRVDQAVMQALAKRPDERFHTMEEFADALGASALRPFAVQIVRARFSGVVGQTSGPATADALSQTSVAAPPAGETRQISSPRTHDAGPAGGIPHQNTAHVG